MAKKNFGFGIVVLVLVFGFTMVACNGGGPSASALMGTWAQENIDNPDSFTISSDSITRRQWNSGVLFGVRLSPAFWDWWTASPVEWTAVTQEDVLDEGRRNTVDFFNEGYQITGIISSVFASGIGDSLTLYMFLSRADQSRARISRSASGAPVLVIRQ